MLKSLVTLICFMPFVLWAQSFPPQPDNYVTDLSNILTTQQRQRLNIKLKRYEEKTTNQFFIYIADSLKGQDLSQLSQEIFHSWRIGSEKNNGLLISIFLTDHKFRIHTGYGLEGALPDILTKRIQDNAMRPEFKSGYYFSGIDKGLDQLIFYSQNEFKNSAEAKTGGISWVIFVLLLNFMLLLCLAYIVKYRSILDPALKKSLFGWGIFVSLMPVLGTLLLLVFLCVAFGLDFKRFFSSKPRSYNDKKQDDAPGILWFDSNADNGSGWGGSDSFSSDNDSDFDGGGGGDSGGGGSDSSW